LCSRGLINSDGSGNGTIHIGGLTVFGTIDSVIKGITAYAPGTAARTVGRRVAPSDRLQNWGEDQLALAMDADIPLEKKFACIANLVNIDVDITRYALLNKDGVLANVADMIHSLPPRANVFVAIQRPHFHWPSSLSNLSSHLWRIEDLRDLRHNILVSSSIFGTSDRYNRILGSFDNPTNPNSGYAVLIKELRDAGYRITVSAPSTVILGAYFGPDGGHGRFVDRELVQGTLIKDHGIEILCERTDQTSVIPNAAI
jgi:hypothetical protein